MYNKEAKFFAKFLALAKQFEAADLFNYCRIA
jgi:hypothetical protein